MNTIILIYLVVCVVLLLFDMNFLVVKRMRNHRYYPKMIKFRNMVAEQITNRGQNIFFTNEFQNILVKKLHKTKYLIALQNVLEKFPVAREWFKPYIFSCLNAYKKKSSYEQAYYAYVVSQLEYQDDPVPKEFAGEFMEFLDSKSLYTFSNTMNAVYEFGEINLLLVAIDKVDERAGFYHQKLLVDGLLQAKVDKQEFSEKLIEHFDGYRHFTKLCLMDYFRFANAEVSDFCMKIVKNQSENQEIRYAAIRYFIKFPCRESEEYFIGILSKENTEWIEEMLAIQGLRDCKTPEVRTLIMNRVSSRNWYVRVKAAEYLKTNGLDKGEIAELISKNDRYTNDLLIYQYQDDKEISDYIHDLLEKEGAE